MDVLYAIQLVAAIATVVSLTCREFAVHKVAQMGKTLDNHQISCLPRLSLEQCALECLLVKMCKSVNHIENNAHKHYNMMCELNSENQEEVDPSDLVESQSHTYIDIQDWPEEIAGTCASRPCGENQRCVPSKPYRCIDIDCGIPPIPSFDIRSEIYHLATNVTLGSKATYQCINNAKRLTFSSFSYSYRCDIKPFRMCNSDSSWTVNDMYCSDE